MKAFLLAAGLGTRLRPLTDATPKCLLPVTGRPLLEIWLELLGRHGVDEVVVNTHHLADRVQDFASRWRGRVLLQLAHEEVLLGSAGTLESNWDFVANEDDFLVCYADNLTDVNLSEMIRAHHAHDGVMTMALFRTATPTACGIVELASDGRVVGFQEKPAQPRSNLANAGIYLMRRDVGPLLPAKRPADIAFDLLPKCLNHTYGWHWPGLLMDIGTPTAYAEAQRAMTST